MIELERTCSGLAQSSNSLLRPSYSSRIWRSLQKAKDDEVCKIFCFHSQCMLKRRKVLSMGSLGESPLNP